MAKISLEEATLKALYDELDDSKEVSNVDGIIDDVLVITDPEVTGDEYDEIIERAQEIIEGTPEGDIPLDEDFLGQYAQTCPLCGATFVNDEILEPGATCPICLEVPEAFIMKGKLEAEDKVAEDNGLIDSEEEENNEMESEESIEIADEDIFEDHDEDIAALEKELASEVIRETDNKLEEAKDIIDEDIDWETKGKENDEIELPSTQEGTAEQEIEDMLDRAEKRSLEETTAEEVIDIHTRIENAETIEEVLDIIHTIEDNALETEAILAYEQCLEDEDDLDTVKDFIIATIEDNAKYEEPLEEDKSALEKSMDALDEIEVLANGDEELLKLGQEMGLADFKQYLQDREVKEEAVTIEGLEGVATQEDIADLEAVGDALNKIWDAIVGGESDFLNVNYREEISNICDQFDAILQAAKDTIKDIEE